MHDLSVVALVVLLFGSSTFFRKVAVDGMSPFQLQVIAGVIYAVLIPMWLRMSPRGNVPTLSTVAAAVAAVLTNVTGAVLFGFLLKKSNDTAVLSSLASASPVVTAALAVVFLGEHFTLNKAAGVVLVIAGMFIFNR